MRLCGMTFLCLLGLPMFLRGITVPHWWVYAEWYSPVDESARNDIPMLMSLPGTTFPCCLVYAEWHSPVNESIANDIPQLMSLRGLIVPCWWAYSEWHSPVDESTWKDIPLLMSPLGMTFPCWWVYSEWQSPVDETTRNDITPIDGYKPNDISRYFWVNEECWNIYTQVLYKFSGREKVKRLLYFRFIQETRKEPQCKKT